MCLIKIDLSYSKSLQNYLEKHGIKQLFEFTLAEDLTNNK